MNIKISNVIFVISDPPYVNGNPDVHLKNINNHTVNCFKIHRVFKDVDDDGIYDYYNGYLNFEGQLFYETDNTSYYNPEDFDDFVDISIDDLNIFKLPDYLMPSPTQTLTLDDVQPVQQAIYESTSTITLTNFDDVPFSDIQTLKKPLKCVISGKAIKNANSAIYLDSIGWVLKNVYEAEEKVEDCFVPKRLFLKKYVESTSTRIVIDMVNDEFVFGYTLVSLKLSNVRSCYKVSILIDEHQDVIFFKDSLLDNPSFNKLYVENITTGNYHNVNYLPKDFNFLHMKIPGINYKANAEWLFEQNKPATYIKTLGKKYTYGLEIETISGLVPEKICEKLNVSSVHDGSLRQTDDNTAYGKEYVTGVLFGDQGLNNLREICNVLTKRCLINHKCGVHVHIGNVNFSKENIILMYHMYSSIQKEVFETLPSSRRNNVYCRELPKFTSWSDMQKLSNPIYREYTLDKLYNEVICFITSKNVSKQNNKKHDHPKGFKCGYDHDSSRYSWVNFVPAVCNTRKNNIYTIEFRPASASTSYIKIKNWLLVCMALVDVIENNKQYVYSVVNSKADFTLEGILKASYGDKAKPIINWVNERKNKFKDLTKEQSKAAESLEYLEQETFESLLLKDL